MEDENNTNYECMKDENTNNNYDHLNTHYTVIDDGADLMINEDNKDTENKQYTSAEKICELLNKKQEQIEENNNTIIVDTSISDNIKDNLSEWQENITELTEKEKELDKLKQEIFEKTQKILKETDFKEIYGANNKDVRKAHLDKILAKDIKNQKDLEYRLDYLKRRNTYLKELIHYKTSLIQSKEEY